jgi:transcriptional pleiotropic regulator of transition state genes
MKATGIVRRIDDLGRVVIPKELRHTMGIAEGDPLEVFVMGDSIVLKKYHPGCFLCGKVEGDVITLHGRAICHKCVDDVSKYANVIKSALL